MTTTSKLGLELLLNAAANQTLANTTFAQLNQLVQPAVVDKDLAAPPSSPADESLYIVGASPTGAWAGKARQLAYWLSATGAWQFVQPQNGFVVKVLDESKRYEYNGTAWVDFTAGSSWAGGKLTSALDEAFPYTVASAATIEIGGYPCNTLKISGSATISSLGTADVGTGAVRRLLFQSSGAILTNTGSLVLPGGATITTRAGDCATFVCISGGPTWVCICYQRADGSSVNESALGTQSSFSTPEITAGFGNTVNMTGTTTITGFMTAASGIKRTLIFADILTLTHNATSLILLGNANVVTAAGDIAEFLSLGSGNWKMIRYTRAAVAP